MIKAENGMTAADCAEQFGHDELADLLRKHSESQVDHSSIANQALALSHYQSNTDLDEVDVGLIEELLMYVCGEKTPASNTGDFRLVQDAVSAVEQDANAILVFLPGWDEITRLRDALEQSRVFGNKSRYQVCRFRVHCAGSTGRVATCRSIHSDASFHASIRPSAYPCTCLW